jgi:hemerythrin-like domain-containing protein
MEDRVRAKAQPARMLRQRLYRSAPSERFRKNSFDHESEKMSDILKILETEHDTLRELLRSLEETTDRAIATREDILEKIEANLLPHAKWEETVFYPEFARRADAEGLKLHAGAVEEHRIVEKLALPDLKGADRDSREFAGRAKVLRTLIEHHAQEEEAEMFVMARQLFSIEERADLARQYEDWQSSATAAALIAGAKLKSTIKAALPG